MLRTACCLLLVVAGCIDGEWSCGGIGRVVLGVVALLLISWELVVIFVAMLSCGCWMLPGGGVLLDEVVDLLFVVSCCRLYG